MSESGQHNSQESTPPSFQPSGNPRSRTRRANQGQPLNTAHSSASRIPSFAPERARSSRPNISHGSAPEYQPIPHAGAEQPVSFAPASQVRRSNTARNTTPEQPASFAPQMRNAASPRTTHNRQSVRPANPTPQNSYTSAHMPVPSVSAGSPLPRRGQRKHRSKVQILGTSLLVILCVIIAVSLLAGFMSISWVNKHLQHESWLTNTPQSSASTWLILGSDQRDGAPNTGSATDVPGSRTDTILLLTKPKKGPASLISIPRDSYVSPKGQDMKINAVASLLGRSDLVGTIEGITGYKIDHVVKIGFSGVERVVDALGGVTLCYDDNVNDPNSGMVWQAGCHTADGPTALAFSRMRYADPQGDIGRAARQRQVIGAIVKKASSSQILSSPSKMKSVAEAGLGSVVVDENSDALNLASMALAFKSATGKNGITGTPYYSDLDYWPDSGIGSTILLDDQRNATLFKQLEEGNASPGVVGGM